MPSIKSEKRKTTKLNTISLANLYSTERNTNSGDVHLGAKGLAYESVFRVRSLKTSATVAGVLFLINQYKTKKQNKIPTQ